MHLTHRENPQNFSCISDLSHIFTLQMHIFPIMIEEHILALTFVCIKTHEIASNQIRFYSEQIDTSSTFCSSYNNSWVQSKTVGNYLKLANCDIVRHWGEVWMHFLTNCYFQMCTKLSTLAKLTYLPMQNDITKMIHSLAWFKAQEEKRLNYFLTASKLVALCVYFFLLCLQACCYGPKTLEKKNSITATKMQSFL